MSDARAPRPRQGLLAALIAVALMGGAARGQDDVAVDDATANQNPQQQGMIQRQMILAANNFHVDVNQYVFAGVPMDAVGARFRLDAALTIRLDDLDRSAHLTEAQKAKLRLAGRGDLARFFDQVEDARRRTSTIGGDQNAYMKLIQELQPMRTAFQAGLFGEGSLFAKTVGTVLDPAQREGVEDEARARAAYRREAKVELVLAMIDASAGLTDDQRAQLRKLIVEETRPPRRPGPYESYVTLLQLSKLPEDRLKAILSDTQRRLIASQFDYARQIELYLTRNNMLPDPVPQR